MSAELDCEQALLVQADFDGELAAAEAFAINQHRAQCAGCTRAHETLRKAREATRAATRFEAPELLRARVLKSASTRKPRVAFWMSGALVGAAAASALFMLVIPASIAPRDALIDSHVRALQSPEHLVDIVSTEHHVVKPWFDGRLSFSPPVKDLASAGYPLRGARIDVLNGQSVAVLVYEAGRHTIDVFVWPQGAQPRAALGSVERGFNTRQWASAGMDVTAISDVNPGELDAFVSRWQTER